MFLRRRGPSAFATPAWMAEILQSVPPENLEKRRQELFEVSTVPLHPKPCYVHGFCANLESMSQQQRSGAPPPGACDVSTATVVTSLTGMWRPTAD